MPVEKVEGGYRWGKSGKVYKRRIDAVKQGQAAMAKGYNQYNKGGDVPEGYHKMPDGSIMKDSEHRNKYYHGGMATKNAKGSNDLRECGMVLSVKDNRK